MSRMTKYLKQTTSWKKLIVDSQGEVILDLYGDPSYESPITLKCRRERSLKDILTVTGAMTRSDTTYYLDETVEIHIGDLLDGKSIIDFEEYVNEHGKTEGYRVVV